MDTIKNKYFKFIPASLEDDIIYVLKFLAIGLGSAYFLFSQVFQDTLITRLFSLITFSLNILVLPMDIYYRVTTKCWRSLDLKTKN